MSEIKVGENETLENALRRFKKKCARAGVLSEVRKRQGRKMKVQRALTLEQQRELLDYVTGHPLYDYWRPLFTVMLGTGCRIGEICGLRWQDAAYSA